MASINFDSKHKARKPYTSDFASMATLSICHIRVDYAWPTGHYVLTRRHPQNRKYTTYCIVVTRQTLIEPRRQATGTENLVDFRHEVFRSFFS